MSMVQLCPLTRSLAALIIKRMHICGLIWRLSRVASIEELTTKLTKELNLISTNMKQLLNIFTGILTLFVALPLWFYTLKLVLDHIQAPQKVYNYFWLYVAATVLVHILSNIAKKYD